ncbi:MAG: cytochrome b/b6 domain-containing protein, partial [Proteobacteria bacterium]|nr:cytochrome b/b6 domain-containing protein [Pseudomonadota bacterium]
MNDKPRDPLIWDLPLRLWHWSLAGAISFSLYSGWFGGISMIDWHMTSGYVVLGLLVFRICWALWGGLYARWHNYRPNVMGVMKHFQGQVSEAAH